MSKIGETDVKISIVTGSTTSILTNSIDVWLTEHPKSLILDIYPLGQPNTIMIVYK